MRDLRPTSSAIAPSIRLDCESTPARQHGAPLEGRARFFLADAEKIAAARMPGLARLFRDGLADDDILDLPEPDDAARHRAPAPVAGGTALVANQFDQSAWSAELDDLLKRPLYSTHRQGAVAEAASGQPDLSRESFDGDAGVDLAGLTEDVTALTRAPGRPRRKSSWMPLLVLGAAAIGMASLVGGAAFGFASPDAKAWLLGAGQLLDQLQIAVSR